MQRTDFFLSIGLIVFGLLMAIWVAPSQCAPAPEFGMPPAALPVACSVLLVGLGLGLLYKNLPKTWSGKEKTVFSAGSLKSVGLNFGLSLAGLLIMAWLGFIAGGFFIVAASMLCYGQRSPVIVGSFSLLVPLAVFLFFRYGLLIKLP
ncbi:tripartite tricarboxylate transporter TctB family protein [Dethiosulfatarculus sandiegensis]|uniref:DUF1468 domain-containing protein n=1 Tax=Dethiosulfatarculus sandiegensis TaxID=1429043 RepID=A0A0D2G8L4_9BACT|nr:tripartite tricarboxylate transporter TctB family protein [Dethiosulfatarculus sandiegensis]KIX11272.1 hypothetical protein X474_26190 [Dethiosulfatarculus sandiegensis]